MEQLLCEPEDRLGSQASASVSRPNSVVIQARRSGFMTSPGTSGSGDGAAFIKVITKILPNKFKRLNAVSLSGSPLVPRD